jgi:hypothetical protein
MHTMKVLNDTDYAIGYYDPSAGFLFRILMHCNTFKEAIAMVPSDKSKINKHAKF